MPADENLLWHFFNYLFYYKDKTIEPVEFSTMLESVRQQSVSQRLLFVFLNAVLPEEHTPEEAFLFEQGMGGQVLPVMRLSKLLDELTTFEALAAEVAQQQQDWEVVVVACVSGENGKAPTEEEANDPLQVLEHTIRMGGDISTYIGFDRDGDHVQFGKAGE
jgi:hypothetical protein